MPSWAGLWRWSNVVLAVSALTSVVGCGGQEPLPASSVGPSPASEMVAVTFPKGWTFGTFATRGVKQWTATASGDGTRVTCAYSATGGTEAHYGGVALPIPGTKAFRLKVNFTRGASAVKAVFVTTVSSKGEDTGRWGYSVRQAGMSLLTDVPCTWTFVPGRPAGPTFWATAGKATDRAAVHFFVDTDPGEDVSFTIERAESQP